MNTDCLSMSNDEKDFIDNSKLNMEDPFDEYLYDPNLSVSAMIKKVCFILNYCFFFSLCFFSLGIDLV
jgi:hypothetical protein